MHNRPISYFAFGVLFVLAPRIFGQTYSPMYAPGVSWRWTVYCKDPQGRIVYYCPMQVRSDAYTRTNAHFHGPDDSTHPRSSIACDPTYSYQCDTSGTVVNVNTLWFGSVPLNITGTIVAQAELVTATNSYGSTRTDFAVGYSDVYYNDHPEIWVKIGGTDTGANTGHGTTAYNRYMMTNAAYGLYYATNDYRTAHPEINLVCTNDMALPYGGKFDICPWAGISGCPGILPWRSPHSQHDRGSAADVAGVGSAQCANAGGQGVNVAEFIARCIGRGAYQAYSFDEGNHAHCGFSDPNGWIH